VNPQAGLRLWPLALIVLIGLVLWAEHNAFWRDTETARGVRVDCETLASGCSLLDDGREIRFGMQGEVKPLAPFDIWVAGVAAVNKAEARFTMEGMDMGFNLYTLRPDAQGVLRAKVTLPICVTGRRDWNMILELDNLRLIIPFVTKL
jgi:hypothetical protein